MLKQTILQKTLTKKHFQDFLTLLRFKSISSDIKTINKTIKWVADQFKQIADIHFFESNKKKSILVVKKGANISSLNIILNGHIDVVNAPDKLFEPIIKDNKIYARGAYDMKAGVFAGMLAMKQYLQNKQTKQNVGLQIVPDEEVGGFDGTLYQLKQGVRSKFVISLEPTNFNIALSAKGVCWLQVTAFGKSAHAAYPWNGKNALLILNKFINNLEKQFKNPTKEEWTTTFNLSNITTENNAMNQIPNQATLKIDIRYIPKQKEQLEKFIKEQEKLLNPKIKILMCEPAFDTPKSNIYVKKLANILKQQAISYKFEKRNGSSDVRHFARYNIDGIEFGPAGGGMHAKDEYVTIDSIGKLANILNRFINS